MSTPSQRQPLPTSGVTQGPAATPDDSQAGFTMLELMIVIAIVAMLAMFGVPQYINQTSKTKLTGALAGVESYKVAVEKCAQEQPALSSCGAGTGDIPAGFTTGSTIRYVDQVAVANGVITITTSVPDKAGAKMTLILTPSMGDTALTWAMSGTGCVSTTNPRGINCTFA